MGAGHRTRNGWGSVAIILSVSSRSSSFSSRPNRGPAMGAGRPQRGLRIPPVGVRRTAFPQCASRRIRSLAREAGVAVHGLFRRQAIAQDVQHRSQRPVGGPMITAGGYTTETAVSAIEPAPAHPGWGAAERLRPFDGLWRRRTRLPHVLLFWLHWRKAKLADAVAFGRMFIANPESRRAIFLRRSQGIVGSATTTISGNVVRAAKFSPTLASC